METKEYLGKTLEVEIDRPFGSKHPKHGFIYPVNYGFVPNTVSGDGEELDCYVLGVFEPVDTFEGKCIAIIHRTNDDDDKLIVVPEGVAYTDDQIRALTEFQETDGSKGIRIPPVSACLSARPPPERLPGSPFPAAAYVPHRSSDAPLPR